MTALKYLRLLIHAHIPTAVYAALMTWLSLEILHVEDFPLMIFVFGATLCSYNFHKWINIIFHNYDQEIKDDTPQKKTILQPYTFDQQFRNVFLLIFIFSLFVLAYYAKVFFNHIIIFSVAACCTIMYTLPNLPYKPFHLLRKIAFAKTFFLAAVWTYVTVFIPFETHFQSWTEMQTIYLMLRFSFIYAICILFDERDKKEDANKGIRSISTMLHPKWTASIYYLTLISSILLSFIFMKQHIEIAIATLPSSFIALFLFNRYKGRSAFYYTLFLDGLMALPACIHLFISI